MKRKTFFLSMFLMLFSVALFAATTGYNTLVGPEQGGSRYSVRTGGSLDVESGGEIDVESGGSLKLAGTALTATAAELNKADADSYSSDGLHLSRIARVSYDFTVDGGTSVGLGVTIPANSVVTRSYYQVKTAFAGTASSGFYCASTGDIKAVADMTGLADESFNEGIQDDTAANFLDVGTSACEVSLDTGSSGALTAGAAVLWLEYVVTD